MNAAGGQPYVNDGDFTLYVGDVRDVLAGLPDESVHCIVTSPPYWGLRDYSVEGQLGLEPTPEEYVANMVAVFRDVRRVLRRDGTCWLNMGDSYAQGHGGSSTEGKGITIRKANRGDAIPHDREDVDVASWSNRDHTPRNVIPGLKPKDLVGIPWRLAFALQADGWYLRSAITWCKPNCMPESVTDRPTKATEMIFFLTRSPRYFYDIEATREPHAPDGRRDTTVAGGTGSLQHRDGERWPGSGRNARDWWVIPTQPFSGRGLFGDDGRILSPSCPVHGDRRRQSSTASHDGRADAPSPHTQYTDARLAPEQLDDSAPTDPPLEPSSAPDSSDLQTPSHALSAKPHNSEIRRKGHAPATTSPYTAFAQTGDRTGDTSASPESDVLFDHTLENRTGQDDSGDLPSAETASRNARISSCTCKYIDHFATFPEALVERCVKAGTSERGCCPKCGAPWTRETETSYEKSPVHGAGSVVGRHYETGANNFDGARMPRLDKKVATIGWHPSCSCTTHVHEETGQLVAAVSIPCMVLDPFLGSGTTALVARRLGRRSIGIELSEEYAKLAVKRMKTWYKRPLPPPEPDPAQTALFALPVGGEPRERLPDVDQAPPESVPTNKEKESCIDG